ncbi:MAG TPA: NADH-quinone oxidoreductase subunit N [Isosphaeraceae bacterium]|jgi:NADH-quinone oxidoreductase subunit N|nr:NADH-quinone oxidoreductase subunit N [Isosphaeraceae bacterium]
MQTTLYTHDFAYIAPEIVLAAWGLVVLVVDFGFLRGRSGPERRQTLGFLTLAGVVIALMALQLPANLGPTDNTAEPTLFFGSIIGGRFADGLNLMLLVLLALVVGMSMAWEFTEHWGEYFALLLWSAVGMMLLVAAEELLLLFLALEMMTICLYLMAAFEKDKRRSAEGGLKYFVYGSVSSALFLFGLSLIYGITGTTRFDAILRALEPARVAAPAGPVGLAGDVAGATAVILVLVGLGFKISAVPFHQWAPDAYEGAPAPVTAWVATGSKIASFVALMKILLHALGYWSNRNGAPLSPGWLGLVAVIAAATMIYGNFAALAQRNFKRMLAYSSIAHAGYILVGVLATAVVPPEQKADAAAAVVYYLVVYGFTTVGAFAVAAWLARDKGRDEIDDLNGLGAEHPWLSVAIALLMLSLIGVPPLAGFFAKFSIFAQALNSPETAEADGYRSMRLPLIWLVFIGLFTSVVSAFYYVRVLKAMFLRAPAKPLAGPARPTIWLPIGVATLVIVGFGVSAGRLLNYGQNIASSRAFSLDQFGYPGGRPSTEPMSEELYKQMTKPPAGGGRGGSAPARQGSPAS